MVWGVSYQKEGSRKKYKILFYSGLRGEGDHLFTFGEGAFCTFRLGNIVAVCVADLPELSYGPSSRAFVTVGENTNTPSPRRNQETTLGDLVTELRKFYRQNDHNYIVTNVSNATISGYGVSDARQLNFYCLFVPPRLGGSRELDTLRERVDTLWTI